MNKKSKEIYDLFWNQQKDMELLEKPYDTEINKIEKEIKRLEKRNELLNNEKWDKIVLFLEKCKKEKMWEISRVPLFSEICLLCKNYCGTPYSYYYQQEGLSGGMVDSTKWACKVIFNANPKTCKSFDLSESRCKGYKNHYDDLERYRSNKITYDKVRDHSGPGFCELMVYGEYSDAYKRLKRRKKI